MRHRKAGIKISRTSSHRDAMFRNMVTSLLKYDKIRTTNVKARELSRWADHIITLAKRGDLHSRRQALAIVREKTIVHKLFEDVTKRFGEINGGYTRIIKIGRRPGDAAPVSIIELVSRGDYVPKTKVEKSVSKKAKASDNSTKASREIQAKPVAPEKIGREPSEKSEDTKESKSNDEKSEQ